MPKRLPVPNTPVLGGSLPSWREAAAVVALVLLAHIPLLGADYVQDDHVAVEKNPVVARGSLIEIFSSSYWKGAEGDDRSLYRPVTILSYALERRLTGNPNAAVSHAVNILLHASVSLLLLVLATRLGFGRVGAITAALLFAVLPVHVEAVANVVGRAELLAALCSLGALLAAQRSGRWDAPGYGGLDTGALGARLASWLAAVFFFLATASKEVAAATFALLVIQEALFRPPRRGARAEWVIDRAAALAPTLLALSVYLVLRTRALEAFPAVQQIHPLDNPLIESGTWDRVATSLGLLVRYGTRMAFPVSLSIDYSGPTFPVERTFLAPYPLAGATILILLLISAVLPWFRKRGPRAAAFASWLFLLPYLVISNIFIPVGAIFAERFAYLPSVGFCLGSGLVADRLSIRGETQISSGRWRRGTWIITAVIVGLMTGRTVLRSLEWHDDESVFAAAVLANPSSPRAHFVLGKIRANAGDAVEATRLLDRAVALWPDHVMARFEKGVILAKTGHLDEAEALLREATRLSPPYGAAHLNLGLVLQRQQRLAEAIRAFRKATLADPALDKAWASLGHVYFETGRPDLAVLPYERAVSLGRHDLSGRLAEARQRVGRSGPPVVFQ